MKLLLVLIALCALQGCEPEEKHVKRGSFFEAQHYVGENYTTVIRCVVVDHLNGRGGGLIPWPMSDYRCDDEVYSYDLHGVYPRKKCHARPEHEPIVMPFVMIFLGQYGAVAQVQEFIAFFVEIAKVVIHSACN
jgi:hypothetical protein